MATTSDAFTDHKQALSAIATIPTTATQTPTIDSEAKEQHDAASSTNNQTDGDAEQPRPSSSRHHSASPIANGSATHNDSKAQQAAKDAGEPVPVHASHNSNRGKRNKKKQSFNAANGDAASASMNTIAVPSYAEIAALPGSAQLGIPSIKHATSAGLVEDRRHSYPSITYLPSQSSPPSNRQVSNQHAQQVPSATLYRNSPTHYTQAGQQHVNAQSHGYRGSFTTVPNSYHQHLAQGAPSLPSFYGLPPQTLPQYYGGQVNLQSQQFAHLHQQLAQLNLNSPQSSSIPTPSPSAQGGAIRQPNSAPLRQQLSIGGNASPPSIASTQQQTGSPLLPKAQLSHPQHSANQASIPHMMVPGYYYPTYPHMVLPTTQPMGSLPLQYQQQMPAFQQQYIPQQVYYHPQQQRRQQHPYQVAGHQRLPIAKFPHITTQFPPVTVTTLPTFTHIVIPDGNQRQLSPEIQPYYSIDVECIATGAGHNDRIIGSIAVVDMHENVVLNVFVKPDQPVTSCLTQLTGITIVQLNAGISVQQAIALVRAVVPPWAVIVGQNILKDIHWLGLEEGKDFSSMADLAGCWRALNPQYNKWSMFSLSHEAKCLLGIIQNEPHRAADDALLSVKLYALWKRLSAKDQQENLAKAHELLLSTEPEPSFSKRYPEIDGVCLGNRKSCTCGQAWFF